MLKRNRLRPAASNGTRENMTKDFFDLISPSTVRFFTDHYIFGNSYRCVYALREHPIATDEVTT